MMNLHLDKELFKEAVSMTADYFGISESIVEKDYYVTMILKELIKEESNFVFKGGTSLSKAFHVINRFSEDIDINFLNHDELTRGKRKSIKKILKRVVEDCGLKITNLEFTRSNRDFNQYRISYNNTFKKYQSLKQEVIVEMAFQTLSYPCEIKSVQSMIGEYLDKMKNIEMVERYELDSFEVLVQSLERTFIDKIFALVDYKISGLIKEHSRHLYDLFKIYPYIYFDDKFYDLFNSVKRDRAKRKRCYSAQPNVVLKEELQGIIDEDIYKDDFNQITINLCYETVIYEKVIDNLRKIINQLH